MDDKHTISVKVNGIAYERDVESRLLLGDFLRENLNLTDTHFGCEHGVFGACTVLLNGLSIRSCLMFAVQADGCEITTVEGLGDPDHMHQLQQSFWDNHGLQCGFCTAGMLMTASDLVRNYSLDTDDDIRLGLSGNICRCTGYQNIVAAVREAVKKLRERASA
jgi:aerobic carbon-monoxide dehydrogenase small subunit